MIVYLLINVISKFSVGNNFCCVGHRKFSNLYGVIALVDVYQSKEKETLYTEKINVFNSNDVYLITESHIKMTYWSKITEKKKKKYNKLNMMRQIFHFIIVIKSACPNVTLWRFWHTFFALSLKLWELESSFKRHSMELVKLYLCYKNDFFR